MSRSINRVTLVGNITRDPEVDYLPSGQAKTRFTVATSYSFKDTGGDWQEKPNFSDVVAWGKTGETVAKFLRKGSGVYVEGRLETRSYEKDGHKVFRTEVIASEVIFMDKAPGGRNEDSPKQSTVARAQTAEITDDDIPFAFVLGVILLSALHYLPMWGVA